jgi:hypothetical protein
MVGPVLGPMAVDGRWGGGGAGRKEGVRRGSWWNSWWNSWRGWSKADLAIFAERAPVSRTNAYCDFGPLTGSTARGCERIRTSGQPEYSCGGDRPVPTESDLLRLTLM